MLMIENKEVSRKKNVFSSSPKKKVMEFKWDSPEITNCPYLKQVKTRTKNIRPCVDLNPGILLQFIVMSQ